MSAARRSADATAHNSAAPLNPGTAHAGGPASRAADAATGFLASGLGVALLSSAVFGFGAGLAGIAGVIGATFQSLSPGEDTRFLLASLVVVIVGGMGSIVGAALGALIIGVAEQMGFVYAPTYSIVLTFLIMAAVLAFRPQGLLGTRR